MKKFQGLKNHQGLLRITSYMLLHLLSLELWELRVINLVSHGANSSTLRKEDNYSLFV